MSTRNPKSIGSYRKQNERQRHETEASILRERDDEQLGEVLAELMIDPTAEVADLARKSGLSEATIRSLRMKVQTTLQAPTQALRRATNARILELVEDRQIAVIEHMSDSKIRAGSLRDQVYALDRLNNIRQLLRGEPTQIVSVDDRKTLNELVPALIRSAQRRGMVIDAVGRALEEPQRGIPDSRLHIEEAQFTEPGAELGAASEGLGNQVRGGVDAGASSAGSAVRDPAETPNESVLEPRASRDVEERAESTEP
jgi:hypothetical protein